MTRNLLNSTFTGISFLAIICATFFSLTACGDSGSNSDDSNDIPGTTEPVDSAEIVDDSAYDKLPIVPVENKTIHGYAQKGPLLKGSNIVIKELDGNTLQETGKEFTGTVLSDSGNYSISNVSLSSQYALIEATGQAKNEVFSSNLAAKLKAIVDLSSRDQANINLLTTLISDRILNLVESGMNVPAAKKKSEKEFLREFGFTEIDDSFEDLNVLAQGNGSAALIAATIIMNGSRLNFLTQPLNSNLQPWSQAFIEDFKTDGKWDNDSLKNEVADAIDIAHFFYVYQNIHNWELISEIPDFEVFAYKFIGKVYGIGECNEARNGEVARTTDTFCKYCLTFYTCEDKKWREPKVKEIYTYGTECTANNIGEVLAKDNLEFCNDCSEADSILNRFYCSDSGWISIQDWTLDISKDLLLSPKIQYGEMTDPRDNHTYKTVEIQGTVWMAQNLNYADSISTPSLLGKSQCYNNDERYCEVFGRLYTWPALVDSIKWYEKYECSFSVFTCHTDDQVQGICPDGWHLPGHDDFENLLEMAKTDDDRLDKLKATGGWIYRDDNGISGSNENGSDEFGFSALPTSFSADGSDTWFAAFFAGSSSVLSIPGSRYNHISAYDMYAYYANSVFSVRCIKD